MNTNTMFKIKSKPPHLLPLLQHLDKFDKSWNKINHYFVLLLLSFSMMFLWSITISLKLLHADNCQTRIVMEYVTILENEDTSVNRLAVLVPYRDRFEELLEFVPYIHKFLRKQRIIHDIFVMNQVDEYRFNRASLINVGFLYTKSNYNYIAMHDVDLLPLNDNLSYAYPEHPYHLAAPELHPRYHYSKFIGGIFLINRHQFTLVNGLSNNYWGWGLEDDEFYVRLKESNLNITRPVNITTGMNNTFRHIHGKQRRRDTTKCYNQREVTRKRDRKTGLHNVKYEISGWKNMTIDGIRFSLINVKLICDFNVTPWCNCTAKTNSSIFKNGKENKP